MIVEFDAMNPAMRLSFERICDAVSLDPGHHCDLLAQSAHHSRPIFGYHLQPKRYESKARCGSRQRTAACSERVRARTGEMLTQLAICISGPRR
ncbi:hypothetical protein AB7M17_006821 [Bradyrhizobium sp. USDA 377]